MTVWSRSAGRAPPPEGVPFALVEKGPRGLVLRALNDAARARGLRRGQSHADARAVAPDLDGRPAEPAREAEALRRLALWAERWSPAVAMDPAPDGLEGLFLDMTGGAHLFGGEAELLARMQAALAGAGARARLALADTPGAAWALARFGEADLCVAPPGGAREALADLPLAALRLDPATLVLAGRFGLQRIADLYPLPRAGLARRFRAADGLGLVRRLDQALGQAPEALTPTRPPPRYRAWRVFAEPLAETAALEAPAADLARALAAQLEQDGQGARRLVLTGFRTDGRAAALQVRLGAPSRRPEVWLRLLRETGLGRLELGFGVDALMLAAAAVEPLAARQAGLDGSVAGPDTRLTELVDRLSARLGEAAVLVPERRDSWIPERAEALVPALAADLGRPLPEAVAGADGPPRPLLLLDPPEPVEAIAELPDGAPARFTWRRVVRRVARAEGPERLAPEWWRPAGRRPARSRDYYRVEDDQGVRYWLFREGLYGREDADRAPGWWMHGVFP